MSGDTLAHFLINRYVDARAMGGENVCVCVCVCVCLHKFRTYANIQRRKLRKDRAFCKCCRAGSVRWRDTYGSF